MSWQAYVDDQLVATGFVKKAAIVGLDGSLWANSPDLNLSADECTKIAAQASNVDSATGQSVVADGVKYMVLRVDADSCVIYGRKGPDGVCVVKTNQAAVIGFYGEGQQPGQCNAVVEKLADYLTISLG
jgi:profilin